MNESDNKINWSVSSTDPAEVPPGRKGADHGNDTEEVEVVVGYRKDFL